jgi:cytochrome c oxidase subunit II
MFSEASNLAEGVDKAFVFIFTIAFIFIIGITAFMIYTVIHFNREKGIPARQFSGNNKLEIVWTGMPLIIVLFMFYYGWVGYAPMRKVPKDAIAITAIGRKWEWAFDYGTGMKSKKLVVPVNKPIRLNLHSEDVNHGLFIPAFRVKQDVIPGYNNYLWFIPTVIGEYEILCTEYCGMLHSAMLSKAVVMDQTDFEKWFEDLKMAGNQPEPPGLSLMRSKGCLACHSLDGTNLVGPSFKGLYGSKVKVIENNKEIIVTADDNYIISSLFDPDYQIVAGFNKGLMKSYKGSFSDSDLKIIIEYFKTLKSDK